MQCSVAGVMDDLVADYNSKCNGIFFKNKFKLGRLWHTHTERHRHKESSQYYSYFYENVNIYGKNIRYSFSSWTF